MSRASRSWWGNSFTRNQDQATPGRSGRPPPGDCLSFACVSVHPAASHLPWRVLSLAGSQVRCSLSHHLELWSWGFLITDFISSFTSSSRVVSGLSAALSTRVCQHFSCHQPSLWWNFFFTIGRKRATLFLSSLSRVHTRAVTSDGSVRSGSVIT